MADKKDISHQRAARTHISVIITAVAGLSISIASAYLVRSLERPMTEQVLEHHAHEYTLRLESPIRAMSLALASMSPWLTTEQPSDEAEKSNQVLQWPQTRARGLFERVNRDVVTEIGWAKALDEDGAIKQAPIKWRVASSNRPDARLHDLAQQPSWGLILEIARDTGDPVMLRLSQKEAVSSEPAKGADHILVNPVYNSSLSEVPTVHDRTANFAGFTYMMFDSRGLIRQTRATMEAVGLELFLYDRSAPVGERWLNRPNDQAFNPKSDIEKAFFGEWFWSNKIDVAGRSWVAVFRPTSSYWQGHPSPWSEVTFFAGLALTIGLGLYFTISGNQTRRLEVMTEKLASSKRRLENEIAERDLTSAVLNRTAANMQAVVTGAPIILFAVDREGLFTLSEGQGLAKIGAKPGEAVGRSIFTIYGNHPNILDDIRRCLGGETFQAKVTMNQAVLQVKYTPTRDGRGNVVGATGVATDVTELAKTEGQLDAALVEHRVLLDNALVAIIHLRKGMIKSVNKRAEELFGAPRDALEGGGAEKLFLDPADYIEVLRSAYKCFEDGKPYSSERQFARASGEEFWGKVYGNAIDVKDTDKGSIWVIEDISSSRAAGDGMRLAATVFETASEGIMVSNRQNQIISVNPAFSEITGYSLSEVAGKDPSILRSVYHDQAFYSSMWNSIKEKGRWEGEIWNRRKNGEVYPEWLSVNCIRNEYGEISNYVGVFSDVTKRKKAEEQVHYHANFDTLTGLPNRRMLHDRLRVALEHAKGREGDLIALLCLDLDNFKFINDSLGHAFGDRLLIEVGQRLKAPLSTKDTVARTGGDGFMIVLPELESVEESTVMVQRILQDSMKTLNVEGYADEVVITASIGVAVYPFDGTNVDDLIRNADTAVYHAKEKGRNTYQYFTDDMNLKVLERLNMEGKLRRAVERRELTLYYQPKVDMRSGRMVGMEALVRWEDPESGLILPDKFIPLAEETGLIVPLGEWVLNEACQQTQKWREAGYELQVAVNLSGRQFHNAELFEDIKAILEETGLPPANLELEITESAIMSNADEGIAILQQLQNTGISLAIDDFGTGYSSLSYLKNFPISALKIDRSFVRDIDEPEGDGGKLVAAIVAIGQSLNLKVVAEGVENEAQLSFLRQQWCDQIQGYLYSRPLTTEKFEDLLRENRRLT